MSPVANLNAKLLLFPDKWKATPAFSWASVLRLLLRMENDIQLPRVLTLQEAAELMQVDKRTLQRLIHRGQFPALRVGGQWRVVESELAKWIHSLEEL